jgi:hypothetical protein
MIRTIMCCGAARSRCDTPKGGFSFEISGYIYSVIRVSRVHINVNNLIVMIRVRPMQLLVTSACKAHYSVLTSRGHSCEVNHSAYVSATSSGPISLSLSHSLV